jgi:hypothetical protein
MSDTPRTDANLYAPSPSGATWVRADFARGLERELNDEKLRTKILIDELDTLFKERPESK